MESYNWVSTGHTGIDSLTDGLRLGDNVVWQVDDLDSFRTLSELYVAQARRDNRRIVYMRFADHEPILSDLTDVKTYELDPSSGFESFATTVHRLIADEGLLAFYVFDSLTYLKLVWQSDLMVMNFFKVTCPFLYELDTIAYFAFLRNHHTVTTIAGIRETTQLLMDLHTVDNAVYLHPLKVWGRHSPTMFFPHRIGADGDASPVTSSEETARLFASMSRKVEIADQWEVLLRRGWDALAANDDQGGDEVKAQLIAVLVGQEGRIVDLAHAYLSLSDLLRIASREIGTGFMGGKSVGMLVARAILEHDPDNRFAARLEPHDSYFIGSDLFFTYIIFNGWWKQWVAQKSPEGYFAVGAELHRLLATGRFPPAIREDFLHMLEYFGQSPIIVRSSSLLEDNFGNAFAGKYESVFCVNQGTPDDRHRQFEDAIRTVYASAMSSEALTYRHNRGLVDMDEQMAVLVQRVSGDHHEDAFFPHAAGVGNSSNLYVWDPSVDMEAGMLRLVVGLGTRAVDRSHHDYARIVTLDEPTRKRLSDPEDLSRFSQRYVDVLSLASNQPESLPLEDLVERDVRTDWDNFVSPDQHALRVLRERKRPVRALPKVVDFARLLGETAFPQYMRAVLRTISDAYGYPVDIEFTLNFARDGEWKINLVQCRPLQTRGLGKAVPMPALTDPSKCLFSTVGNFMGGNVRLPIDYVVAVLPEAYLALGQQDKHGVAREIGVLNRLLADSSNMFMCPGRWGTTTPSLGVPVHFTEVSNAAVLAEVTYAAGGFRPELSYGSHFFQDLVESGVFYVAVFDEHPDVVFNPELVLSRPNMLVELDPQAGEFADVIHVAWFPDLVLYSDIVTQRLVCL